MALPTSNVSPEEEALRRLVGRTGGYSTEPLYSRLRGATTTTGGGGGGGVVPGPIPGPMPPAYTGGMASPQMGVTRTDNPNAYTGPSIGAEAYSAPTGPSQGDIGGLSLAPVAQYAGSAYGVGGLLGHSYTPQGAAMARNALGNAMSQATISGRSEQGMVNIGTAENPKWVTWGNFVRGYDDEGNLLPLSGNSVRNQFEAGPDVLRVEGMNPQGVSNGNIFEIPGAVTPTPGGQFDAALMSGQINPVQQTYNPNLSGYVPMDQVPGLRGIVQPGDYNPNPGSMSDGQWAYVEADADGVTAAEMEAMGVDAYDPMTGERLTDVPPGKRVVTVKRPTMTPDTGTTNVGIGAASAKGNLVLSMSPEARAAFLASGEGQFVMRDLQRHGLVDASGNIWDSRNNRWSDGKGHYYDSADGKWYNEDGSLSDDAGAPAPTADTPPSVQGTVTVTSGPVPAPAAGGTPAAPATPATPAQPGTPAFSPVDSGAYEDPLASPQSVDEVISKTGVAKLQAGQQTGFIKYEGKGNISPYDFPGYIVYYQPKGSTSKYRAKAGTIIYPGDKISLEKLKPGHRFSYSAGRIYDEADPNAEVEQYAFGGRTGANTFVAGDPQVPGKPNPELINIDWENRKADIVPMYAFGGTFSGVGDWLKERMAGFGGSPFGIRSPNMTPAPPLFGAPPVYSPAATANTAGNMNQQNQWSPRNDGTEGGSNAGGSTSGGSEGGNAGGSTSGGSESGGPVPPPNTAMTGPLDMRAARMSPAIRSLFFAERDRQFGLPAGSSGSEWDMFRLRGANAPGRMRI